MDEPKGQVLNLRLEIHMTLEGLKKELTVAKSERSFAIRQGQSTAEIDAKIAEIKAQIDAYGLTPAQVSASGGFSWSEPKTSTEQLARRDAAVDACTADMARRHGAWSEVKFLRT